MADHADHSDNSGHAAHAAPHNDSLKWLYIGVIVSLLIGAAIGLLVSVYLNYAYPIDEYDLVDGYTSYVGGFVALVVALLIFAAGIRRVFVGQTGYLMWLGNPEPLDGQHLGPGFLWVLPLFMSLELHSGTALDVATGDQESATGDGVETRWSAKSTYRITNLALYQASIAEVGVPNYVDGVLVEAMRKTITYLNVKQDGTSFNLADLTPQEAAQLAPDIAKFKTNVKNNGKQIQDIANEKLSAFGLYLGPVQITNIKLSEVIENRIQELIDEALQSVTLTKDANNKKAQVNIYNQVFKENGIDLTELAKTNPDLVAELLSQNLDRAAANEGKATITRHNFSGRPPAGTIMNVGEK